MTIDLDVTLFIKETQLQHGLRAEDYLRYHHYTTNRLAALRHQLNLSNDKKKFLKKEVTPLNATDARHLMLLVLYAERCWAAAEAMQVKLQAQKDSRGDGGHIPKGGVPPPDQYRKRLNKALKWAEKLVEVAKSVATDRAQRECTAYMKEVCGRCHASHGRFKDAKETFAQARDSYAALRRFSTDAQWMILVAKIYELDDRVAFCMQRLGEDPSSYKPTSIIANEGGSTDADAGKMVSLSLQWNGRSLTLTSIKVKDALREANAVEVESAAAKAIDGASGPIAVGQSNRVLDLMDRRIGYFNDALAHARQDLRAAPEGVARTQYQLIVHYILFHVAQESLRRTLFLVEVYARRFRATERSLAMTTGACSVSGSPSQKQRRKAELLPAQYASPMEVVQLYKAALGSVEEMELLPGVAGQSTVESYAALCQAGQVFYTGESWRVAGDMTTAMENYRTTLALLRDASGSYVAALRGAAEQQLLQTAAEAVLTSSSSTLHSTFSPSGKTDGKTMESASIQYLTDAKEDEVVVAQNVIRFPPDFQAAPCKPVFVDIASTYLEYPTEDAESTTASQQEVGNRSKSNASAKDQSGKAKEEKKWGWKFGWGN